MPEIRCVFCEGNQFKYLGSLGLADWFRCRSCGEDQSVELDELVPHVNDHVAARAPRRTEAVCRAS